MEPTGHTSVFAVLGHPVGHTLSPPMHNAAFRALGMDAVYLAFDVAPERLPAVLPAMAGMGFRGVNLTVPLKEVAFRNLTDLDASARLLGAVNTVEFRPGSMRGHNTDGKGFLLAVQEAFGTGVRGASVFILGTGGAGRAVAMACAVDGAASLVVADIDRERAARVAAEVASQSVALRVEVLSGDSAGWRDSIRKADLVVQATPVGMKREDPSPLGAECFRKGQAAFDLVYMFPQTAFMATAARGGARTANGLGMLLHQGAHAFTIWTGREAPVDVMRRALEERVYSRG